MVELNCYHSSKKRLRHYLNWVRSQYFYWKMSHNTFENAEVFFRFCLPSIPMWWRWWPFTKANVERHRKFRFQVSTREHENGVFKNVLPWKAFLRSCVCDDRFTDRIRLPSWPMRKEKRFQTKWDTHCITLFHNVKLLFIGTCACNFLQFSILPDEGWWWTAELLYQTINF